MEIMERARGSGKWKRRLLLGSAIVLGCALLSEILAGRAMRREKIRRNAQYDRPPTLLFIAPDRLHLAPVDAPDTFRVAVVGDSIARGLGVFHGDSFGVRLERLLNLNPDAPPATVALHTESATSTQTQWPLISRAIDEDPRVLILIIGLNDTRNVGRPDEIQRWEAEADVWKPPAAAARLLGHSRTFTWVLATWQGYQIRRNLAGHAQRFFEPSYSGWRRFRESIATYRDACGENGIVLMAAVLPVMDFLDDYPFEFAHRQFRDCLRELEVPHVDLLADYQGRDPDRMMAVPGQDAHLSEIAHRIAAEAIFEFLIGSGAVGEEFVPVHMNCSREDFLSRCRSRAGPWQDLARPLAPPQMRYDDALRAFVGARTRVVWCRATESPGASREACQIVGLDTDDGRGERVILPETDRFRRPLISSDGKRVVFTRCSTRTIEYAAWDGARHERLGTGFAADVWRDPQTGFEWVYAVRGADTNAAQDVGMLVRFRLDQPQVRETIWTQTMVAADGFQLSADGTHASAFCPAPMAGVIDFTDRCWGSVCGGDGVALAPDDSYLLAILRETGRGLAMFPRGRRLQRTIWLSYAPAVFGHEVRSPRWSNDPRFLVFSGPHADGGTAGREATRREESDIHMGCFAPGFRDMDRWLRVTRNEREDREPDAWVDPDSQPRVWARAPSVSAPVAPSPPARQRGASLVVQARLDSTVEAPMPASIRPYKRAMVVYGYAIDRIEEGEAPPGNRVAVAHWAVLEGKPVVLNRKVGESFRMRLERYADHPELDGERQIVDPGMMDLPLYIETGSVADGKGDADTNAPVRP